MFGVMAGVSIGFRAFTGSEVPVVEKKAITVNKVDAKSDLPWGVSPQALPW